MSHGMMGMADMYRQEVNCGQCFEEFYGQEYCQNLRKDLEKLKDEYYDSDSHRFWREWVAPTVNLLKRLSYMGFPVRNKDYVLIHLYNPVDSMAMGELHFQVGRKSPGTLTLKYTKQNPNGTFTIQPRTLDGTDELKLSLDPVAFLDTLRHELKEATINALNVLVLMTDSCKLQRQCAKTYFARNRNDRYMDHRNLSSSYREPQSSVYSSSTSNMNGPSSMLNTWAPPSFNPDGSLRQSLPVDGSFPLPWNFCVKNYVNYPTSKTSEVSIHGAQPFGQTRQIPRKSSLAARQEPEESDETQEPPGCSTSSVTEAMAKLWDPPSKAPQQQMIRSPQGSRVQARVTEDYAGQNPQVSPTAIPRSYTNEMNRLMAPQTQSSVRRHSEPKISHVEEYCVSGQPKSTEKVAKTSLTEEYINEQNKNSSDSSHSSGLRLDKSSASSRTDLVDSYIGDNTPSGSGSRTSSLDDYVGDQASRNTQTSTTNGNYRLPDTLTKTTVPIPNQPRQFLTAEPPNGSHYPQFDPNRRQMIESWMHLHHHQQPNLLPNENVVLPGMEPHDMSILSQSSFSSWTSHRDYQPMAGAPPLIPLVVQNINRGDYQSWDRLKTNQFLN